MVEISLDHLSLDYLDVQDYRVVEPIRYQALCDRVGFFMKAQRWDSALNTANRAIGLDADRYEGWMFRANALLMLARYHEALLSCDRSLELNQSAKVLALRGIILHRLGRYEESYANYRQAMGRKPRSFWQHCTAACQQLIKASQQSVKSVSRQWLTEH
jgi:tetratricopeptide (TPR) repeat protein